MKDIPQQIIGFFSSLINIIYNENWLAWFFIVILLFAIGIPLFLYIYYSHWDGGIDKAVQNDLQIHHPFDGTKGILYVSRRVVGFWESETVIHRLHNEAENRVALNILAQNYNLILYIPRQDQNNVYVYDLEESTKFIIDNDFPICYITQHMPPRNKVKPFSCNDEKLWFVEYKKEMKSLKWEGYS